MNGSRVVRERVTQGRLLCARLLEYVGVTHSLVLPTRPSQKKLALSLAYDLPGRTHLLRHVVRHHAVGHEVKKVEAVSEAFLHGMNDEAERSSRRQDVKGRRGENQLKGSDASLMHTNDKRTH
jgi:hypothetical protein